MILTKLKKLLRKYNADKATAAERRVVDIWYESFSTEANKNAVFEGNDQREAVRKQIWDNMNFVRVEPSWLRRNQYVIVALGVAATLLLVFSLNKLNTALDVPAVQHPLHLAASKTLTGDRERKLVTLPDSSRVWLNANSSLSVSAGYGTAGRHVDIEGEAFFDVTPNGALPFVVDSKHLRIKVLGTAFNVSAYPSAAHVRVGVDHGRVAVMDGKGTSLGEIAKGQSLHYSVEDSIATILPTVSVGTWREGSVLLERAKFSDLARVFYNIYGIRLTSHRKDITRYSYNLQISAKNPLEHTMEVISSMHRLKHRREKDEIVLY